MKHRAASLPIFPRSLPVFPRSLPVLILSSFSLAFILCPFFAGCRTQPNDDAKPTAINDPAAAAQQTETAATPQRESDNAEDEDNHNGGEGEGEGLLATNDEEIPDNQIDTVRPPATRKPEPIVPLPVFPPPAAGAMIDIPAGQFLRGSAPQDPLRDQFAENDALATDVTPFQIDVLPWPNDPAIDYLVGVPRAEAEALCASVGKRLCTEIEWEFACRSTDSRRYPSGNTYEDSRYAEHAGPASPFGVYGFGKIMEWTASAWGGEADQVERAAVRGWSQGALTLGEPTAPEKGRRCAKRHHRTPTLSDPEVGFRCCKGTPNKAVCTIEGPRPSHSLYTNIKPEKFAEVIRMIPELAPIHDNPHMYSDGDVRTVLARRASDRQALARSGIHFHWKPLRWIPRQGTELWVAVGRSNRHAFIVALHETIDNEAYVHGSSLILWDTPAPIAIAWREGHRDQVYWAPCWGCRDGGTIEWDDARNEVIITHKW